MFDRSRYNWATTQVEASCKFEFAATDEAIDSIKSFLAQDEMFEMTNARRKSGGVDWYHALAAVLFSLRDNNNEDELPGFVRSSSSENNSSRVRSGCSNSPFTINSALL